MDKCGGCGQMLELRLGFCFDCSSRGEERAAKRTVAEHLKQARANLAKGSPNWRFDLHWAWERFTQTGDYAPGGYFDKFGIHWRGP